MKEYKIETVGNFVTRKSVQSFVSTQLRTAEEFEEFKIENAQEEKIVKQNVGREEFKIHEKIVELCKNEYSCNEIEPRESAVVPLNRAKKIQNENVQNGKFGKAKIDIDLNLESAVNYIDSCEQILPTEVFATGNAFLNNLAKDFKYFEPG